MFVKNTLFSVTIVTVFFLALEALLALLGVRPVVLTEDPLLGFADNMPQFVEATGVDGSAILQTAENKRRLFNYQEFPSYTRGKMNFLSSAPTGPRWSFLPG